MITVAEPWAARFVERKAIVHYLRTPYSKLIRICGLRLGPPDAEAENMSRGHIEKCGDDERKIQSHPSSEDGGREVISELFYPPSLYQCQWPVGHDVS